jgi:DNA polymerase III subunit beta
LPRLLIRRSALLAAAVAATTRAVGRSVPGFTDVLAEVRTGEVVISRATSSLFVCRSVPVESEANFTFTTPAKPLQDLLQLSPDGPLELDVLHDVAKMRIGPFDAEVRVSNASDFPMQPKVTSTTGCSVAGMDLSEAISRVKSARSSDEDLITGGIRLRSAAGNLVLAATDGHRAAEATIVVRDEWVEFDATVPSRALSELAGILPLNLGSVRILPSVSNNWIRFEAGRDFMEANLIDGPYPAYREVLPASRGTSVLVDRDGLLLCLRGCSIFAGETNPVSLHASVDRVVLSGETSEFGRNRAEAPAKVNGSPIQTQLFGRYLEEALQPLPAGPVELQLAPPPAPVIVREGKPPQISSWTAIMPISQAST